MGKSGTNSMDKDSNAEAVTSRKPPWDGIAPNTEPVKPPSLLAKQEIKSIPRVMMREVTGMEGTALTETEGHAMLGGEARESHYQKVRRLQILFTVEYLS